VSGLVDLLDFGYPFEKISVRIFEIGEEHVPRPVAPRSVNPLGPAVTQMNQEFRQLTTPWKMRNPPSESKARLHRQERQWPATRFVCSVFP